MTVEPSAAPHFRIPEPDEIIAWLRARWMGLQSYLAVPEHQLLLGVLSLGALLRLGFIDLIPIRDETIALFARIAGPGTLAQRAAVSGLGTQPDLVAGIYRALALVSRDPRWLVGMQVLVEMLSLTLFYHLARRRLGSSPAIIALIALAINPWCVHASRTLSAQAWFVALAVGTLYGVDLALEERRLAGWLLQSLCLVAMIYMRLGNATLLCAVAVLALLYRKRIDPLHLVLAILLGLVFLLPGLWSGNLGRFGEAMTWAKEWGRSLVDAEAFAGTVRSMVSLVAGQGLGALAAPVALDWGLADRLLGLNTLLGWVAVASIPVSVWIALRAWGRWRDGDQGTLLVIACVWLVIGLVTVWRGDDVAPLGALLTCMPAASITLAIAVDRLLALPNAERIQGHWWSQPLRLALVILLVGAGGWQAYQTLHLAGHVGQEDVSEGYGVPYRYWRRTANLVEREAQAGGFGHVWLLARSNSGMLAQAPEMMDYLLEGDVRVVTCGSPEVDGVLLPAAQPGLYLTTGASPMAERAISLLGAEDRGLVLYPDGRSQARIRVVEERPVQDHLAPIEHRGLWVYDSGAKLLGIDWPSPIEPGQPVLVANYWTFGDMAQVDRELEHVVFCRLLDTHGGVIAEAKGFALGESDWELGLMLKQWWELELPAAELPEELFLQIGMYRPEDGYRNLHLDGQGYPVGEAVLIGPLPRGY